MRVLVADDDPIAGDIARRMLTRLGVETTLVHDGEEALAALDGLEAQSYDLAFLDIGMPKLDGIETARRIRAGGSTLPLVALTGGEGGEDLAEAGFSDFIEKPYDFAALRRVLGMGEASR